ncbi:MAG: iron complex transport system substrate-binding protein, partial [Oleispira sp.]
MLRLVSFIAGIVFAANSLSLPSNSSSTSNSTIKVIDDEGIEHNFDQPVKRIVSLMPHATELLFEVGAGEHIVGAVQYSDYPEAAKNIPRVGGYSAL